MMKTSLKHIHFYCLILTVGLYGVNCQNRFIDQLLPDDYDPQVPPLKRGYVHVNSTIKVHYFAATDNQLNLVTDLTLCLRWRDYRILPFQIQSELDNIPGTNITENIVILTNVERLWLPNVYFRNAFEGRPLNNRFYVEVFPNNKTINYCTRIYLTFVCRFLLSNFPFDEHYCHFELESFGRSIPILRLHMDKYIQSPGHNPQFRVRGSMLGSCKPQTMDPFQQIYHAIGNTGNNESCVYAGLRIVRHVNYYIIRYYLMTFLLVAMCYVEFYYPTTAWPARIILTCVVLINIMGISREGYREVPSKDVVSLFWWFWGCQFFVYMGLIEFALALAWVQFVLDKTIAHEKNVRSPDGHYFGQDGWYRACGNYIEKCLNRVFGPIPFFANPEGRNKVDYCARVVFPLVFLFYLVIYIIATIPAWVAKY